MSARTALLLVAGYVFTFVIILALAAYIGGSQW
jgi:hypothetical protein